MAAFATEILQDRDLVRDIGWLLSQPLFWAVLGMVTGPYLFLKGFAALRLKRHISNTPRSTIRGAALGPVEVSGKAVGPYTLVAPFSKSECLCYWLVKEDGPGSFSSRYQKKCAPIYLDDGTGTLMISPNALQRRLSPSFSGSFERYPIRADEGPALRLTQQLSGAPDDSRSVQEYVVRPGDPIFVFGSLQENPWLRTASNSEASELSRIGPGFLSEGEAEILRCEAFPFLDPTLPATEATASNSQFDLDPPTILVKGTGPFLISNSSQREILSTLSWKSVAFIWGGPIWTLWAVWEIAMHPVVWQSFAKVQ